MSERKVLTKYFPPDFDPSAITRQRGKKDAGLKLQTVRLMAPFSMKCTHCGEFIYKGRKFNARKETTDEMYHGIKKFRFYIRCTRCSGEITFKTDPKNMDYECERGAKRNFEPWREAKLAEETEEERLDRIEREEAERDAMKDLETKVVDAKTEMAIADALDEIRSRNARMERAEKGGIKTDVPDLLEEKRKKEDEEDAAYAKEIFSRKREHDEAETVSEWEVVEVFDPMDDMMKQQEAMSQPKPAPRKKQKVDRMALLGLKRKTPENGVDKAVNKTLEGVKQLDSDKKPAAPAKPAQSALLVDYPDSDED